MTRSLRDTLPHLLLAGGEDDQARMSLQWGRVQGDGLVRIDTEGTPLPPSVTSLVPLSPGLRVAVLRYGRGVLIVGASRSAVQLPIGQHADEVEDSGGHVVPDGAFVSPDQGFPVTGEAGWLEVTGDGVMILQRYTTVSGAEWRRSRDEVGVWSPWTGDGATRGGIALSAPWAQYGTVSAWGSPSWSVSDGVVSLSGMVTGGVSGTSSEPVAVLPAEARPYVNRLVAVATSVGPANLQVTPAGVVYLPGQFSGGWVSLSGAVFPR